ncbi:hypothetical protein KKY_2440 [Pelagibacterium halotolerans B2]|uniref:Uncharacterized protein n=1 Tax=Pelagibacterium halotolerans (strain DSM 22347 / JCM 15775 / CGMCC 1.7692 / B2) TaxID=1082931 RepID=G4R968_PELHB|nr:hypothetical protein KKY_2440 [Pelagibacterium halotolerans B2]
MADGGNGSHLGWIRPSAGHPESGTVLTARLWEPTMTKM